MTNEEFYIGCVLVNKDTLYKYPVSLRYFGRRRDLLQEIIGLITEGEDVDTWPLGVRLKGKPCWPGVSEVEKWRDAVVSYISAGPVAKKIEEEGKRDILDRWLRIIHNKIKEDDIVMQAQSEFGDLFVDDKSAVRGVYDHGKDLFSGLIGESQVVETGNSVLDENWILDNGGLHIIAGRTGMGKTSMGIWVAERVAECGVPVLFFSLEMTATQMVGKMVSNWTGVPTEKMYKEFGDSHEAIADALDEHKELPVYIDDGGDQTVEQMAIKTRFEKQQKGIGLVIVDYLQTITPSDRHIGRHLQIGHSSRALKILAKSLKIPVIALAQVGRSAESRESSRPRLSDLRESGNIEQDADSVMLLYRPGYYNRQDPALDGVLQVDIAKQRRIGPRDVVGKWDLSTNTLKWGREIKNNNDSFGYPEMERRAGQ